MITNLAHAPLLATLCLGAMVACRADLARDDGPPTAPPDGPRAASVTAEGAPPAAGDRPALCARRGDDLVRDVFCRGTPPRVTSLRALQDLLRLNPEPPAVGAEDDPDPSDDPFDVVPVAALLGHSTALSGGLVSPINPRAIIMGREAIMAFQRGVQQVELASRARGQAHFNFYLLTFRQACNPREAGCGPGDLYTPEIERAWTETALFDDDDLANTASDCRLCHQRGRTTPILLMRELESPWTHFFERDTRGEVAQPGAFTLPDVRGHDLVRDYVRAKGDEPYAALSLQTITDTIGITLQNAVPAEQPLLFDAPAIEDERWPYGPDGYPSTPRTSASWARSYDAFKRGEQLPLPHFAPRPTDPSKQARLTEAYRRYREGSLPASALPDLSDIFPDDPQTRAEIGLQTEPLASPAEALIQACGACHNDVLDQTLSRARFNIALSRMSPAQRSAAVARLELASGDRGAMPPPEHRQLDPDAREGLIAYLREAQRSPEDDALLDRAARLGMSGAATSPDTR